MEKDMIIKANKAKVLRNIFVATTTLSAIICSNAYSASASAAAKAIPQDFLKSIRSGVPLRHVEKSLKEEGIANSEPQSLMGQIRSGVSLRSTVAKDFSAKEPTSPTAPSDEGPSKSKSQPLNTLVPTSIARAISHGKRTMGIKDEKDSKEDGWGDEDNKVNVKRSTPLTSVSPSIETSSAEPQQSSTPAVKHSPAPVAIPSSATTQVPSSASPTKSVNRVNREFSYNDMRALKQSIAGLRSTHAIDEKSDEESDEENGFDVDGVPVKTPEKMSKAKVTSSPQPVTSTPKRIDPSFLTTFQTKLINGSQAVGSSETRSLESMGSSKSSQRIDPSFLTAFQNKLHPVETVEGSSCSSYTKIEPQRSLPTQAELDTKLIKNYERWHQNIYNKPADKEYSLQEWEDWFKAGLNRIGSSDALNIADLPKPFIDRHSEYVKVSFEQLFQTLYKTKHDDAQHNGEYLNMNANEWVQWYDNNKDAINAEIEFVRAEASKLESVASSSEVASSSAPVTSVSTQVSIGSKIQNKFRDANLKSAAASVNPHKNEQPAAKNNALVVQPIVQQPKPVAADNGIPVAQPIEQENDLAAAIVNPHENEQPAAENTAAENNVLAVQTIVQGNDLEAAPVNLPEDKQPAAENAAAENNVLVIQPIVQESKPIVADNDTPVVQPIVGAPDIAVAQELRDNAENEVDGQDLVRLFEEPEDHEPAQVPLLLDAQNFVPNNDEVNNVINLYNADQEPKQLYLEGIQYTAHNDFSSNKENEAQNSAFEYKASVLEKLTLSIKENNASAIISALNEYNKVDITPTNIDEILEASRRIAVQTLFVKAGNDGEMESLTAAERIELNNILGAFKHQTKGEVDSTEASKRDLDPNVSEATGAAHNALAETLGRRLDVIRVSQSEDLGIAAGSEEDSIRLSNIWISGLYGSSIQGDNGSSRSYKGKIAGGAIGFDVEINDNQTLGLAYANVVSAFNYRHNRSDDKTKADTHILSLYSQTNFSSNFVWNNIASISRSYVKAATKPDNVIAKGKFKSDGFGFNTNLGYKIHKNNTTFVPNIGLRYDYSKDASYTESGAGRRNLKVAAQSNEMLAGNLGIKAMFKHQMENGVILMPSLNASVDIKLMNKAQKVRARYVYTDEVLDATAHTGVKAPRFSYNIGGGLIVQKNNLEVSAHYNLNLAKKYAAHQGSLKLKVMF